MVIAGLGLIFSIIGASMVKISKETDSVQKALNIGNWTSILLTAIATYFVVQWMLPAGDFHMIRDEDAIG
jgi:K(+)-stimulated pyrophosphate-energized sodium pump